MMEGRSRSLMSQENNCQCFRNLRRKRKEIKIESTRNRRRKIKNKL